MKHPNKKMNPTITMKRAAWSAVGVLALFLSISLIWRHFYLQQDLQVFHLPPQTDTEHSRATTASGQQRETIRILSISGGGIRGIIPLEVLQYIEKQSGKRISELFDIVAGTSVGSIISNLLVTPGKPNQAKYTAEQVANFFYDAEFRSSVFSTNPLHAYLTLDGYIGPKYRSADKGAVLKKLMDETPYGNLLLPSITMSYFPEKVDIVAMKNLSDEFREYPTWLLVHGASSPPSYFPPVTLIDPTKSQSHTLSDAAIATNDPIFAAINESGILFPNKKYLVVHLGTGYSDAKSVDSSGHAYWGKLQWASPIVPTIMDLQAMVTGHLASQLVEMDAFNGIHIFNFDIGTKNLPAIDDTSPESIRALEQLGTRLVEQDKKELDKLVSLLLH